jgi:hypothetical protein
VVSPNIILPRSAEPKFRCRVPTGENATCGKPFWDEGQFVRHVTKCAREHEQAIQEQSPRTRVPILYDRNLWDPEYEDHMMALGRRMEREGRIEAKPHER